MKTVSVLIPAHNESAYLPACLEAVLASDPVDAPVEVIVAANGCSDDTVAIAQGFEERLLVKGWLLKVLDIAEGGKLGALNRGEATAQGDVLIYVDADVAVSRALIGQIAQALDTDQPRYASGHPNVTVGNSAITRLFTRFWRTIPFMTNGVPGFGVFAMNRAGRARWDGWPDIISDDTFARLSFAPSERISVPATYDWPMIEGFGALVRVRRRQDAGVAQIAARYPALIGNDDPNVGTPPLWERGLRDPLAFAAFLAVRLAAALPTSGDKTKWVRGR
jgi:glycosyltransferase involved in cell wall biosynthesis